MKQEDDWLQRVSEALKMWQTLYPIPDHIAKHTDAYISAMVDVIVGAQGEHIRRAWPEVVQSVTLKTRFFPTLADLHAAACEMCEGRPRNVFEGME